MTPRRILTLTALLATAYLTPMAAGGLHAQTPPGYVVNEIQVTDPAGFATYAAREGALIERFGGKFLARGGEADSIAGTLPPRVTIYVFDSLTKARAWRDAPEQTELAAIRDRSAHFRSFIVEGCAACAAPHG